VSSSALIVSPGLIRMRDVIYSRGEDDLTEEDKTQIASIAKSLVGIERFTLEENS